jgi:hypothetical protein
MKRKIQILAMLLLISLLLAACGSPEAPTPTPSGAVSAAVPHAPRLDTLEGKTICELSLDEWESHRALPTVRERLRERFTTVTFVPYIEFPMGLNEVGKEETAQLLVEGGCQAVVFGSVG